MEAPEAEPSPPPATPARLLPVSMAHAPSPADSRAAEYAKRKLKKRRTALACATADEALPPPVRAAAEDKRSGGKSKARARAEGAKAEGDPPGSHPLATYVSAEAPPSTYPCAKYSDLSGAPAKYACPRTGLRYATAAEFALLRSLTEEEAGELLAARSARRKLR